MLTPYWTSPDGKIAVYHARWEDVLAAGLIPVREVKLVHADPPYGIGNKQLDRKGRRGLGRDREYDPMVGNDDAFDPSPLLALERPLVAWGGNHFSAKLPSSPTWIVWDKRDGMPSDDGSDAELAWCTPGGPLGNRTHLFHHMWRGLCRASEKNGKTGPGHAGAHLHPTQKPIALSSYVFRRAKLTPGDLVLVPYLGSGPDLPAAVAMGLRVIACDVEQWCCDTAIGRLGAITAARAAEPVGPLFEGLK